MESFRIIGSCRTREGGNRLRCYTTPGLHLRQTITNDHRLQKMLLHIHVPVAVYVPGSRLVAAGTLCLKRQTVAACLV